VEASQSKLLRRRHQVIRQQGKTLCWRAHNGHAFKQRTDL
jgi:hypothetical protein